MRKFIVISIVLVLTIIILLLLPFIPLGIEGKYPDTWVGGLGHIRSFNIHDGKIERIIDGRISFMGTYKRISINRYECNLDGKNVIIIDLLAGLYISAESLKTANSVKGIWFERFRPDEWLERYYDAFLY